MLSTPQIVRHFGKHSITSSLNLTSDKFVPPKPSKRPQAVRGGQNLSERFKWLENSLRGKNTTTKREPFLTAKSNLPVVSSAHSRSFHGFHVPEEPIPPADEECCMSGCAVCVYDLYEESLVAYKDEVDALRKALTGLKIPESEWPAHIQLQNRHAALGTEAQRREKVLNAFEEMERALALKKQQQIEKDRS